MIPMIKGEKADYSASLFEIKGVSIIYKESGVFVDVLKGVYPDHIAKKIIRFHLGKKLNKDFNFGGFVGKTIPNRKAI
ncbi:hypothetical protein YO81_05085 [Campylobacter jejuni]|nr:hypothetical protein [Campylobacter jejuni]